jgi:hypothetical protein
MKLVTSANTQQENLLKNENDVDQYSLQIKYEQN